MIRDIIRVRVHQNAYFENESSIIQQISSASRRPCTLNRKSGVPRHFLLQEFRMDLNTNSYPYQADIVFLNGPSSSGKSSLAVALQNVLDYPFLRLDIDDFLAMFPERYQGLGERAGEGILQTDNPEGAAVSLGSFGEQFVAGFHHALAAFARQGNKLIVVHLLLYRSWLLECAELLKDYRILFVGIQCESSALEERELRRGNRSQGFALRHHRLVHSHAPYDLLIDSTHRSPLECAEIIRARIMEPPATNPVQRMLRSPGNSLT